ncbi:MHC class II transactivator isoform X2 [Hippoglossus stenolepis]|uniref:MHC class II transactivator isoform X2 n=1 Tax=Hippoglossus stenolepis TaxID=195615 RepID=UPI001FAF185E|nr:MHC class II transactivator isoform X2 [Hippoglossus stenolepis]
MKTQARCPDAKLEVKTELRVACRTLDLYNLENTDSSLTLDTRGAADSMKGLCYSASDSITTTGVNMEPFSVSGAAGNASPVEACADNITATCLEDHLCVRCVADGTTHTTDDLMCVSGDAQWGTDAGFADVAHLFLTCSAKDSPTKAQDYSSYSEMDQSMTLDNLEQILRTDFYEEDEDEGRVGSHWGAKMLEVDQDPHDFGDLPDDLSEFLDDEYLLGTDVFFGDPWFNPEELTNFNDVAVLPEQPCTGGHQQGQTDQFTGIQNKRRKRQRVPRSQRCTDEKKPPSTPKRHRAAGADVEAKLSPAEAANPTTTPTRFLHLQPPIHFITIPDSKGYQLIPNVRLSPPVIRLRLPSAAATPTYILVPSASTPCKPQLQPLSPVDAAVVPVQMSSSPPGSLSDTASRAMSPPHTSISSRNTSSSNESPPPQSSTVLDIPESVKDYIQKVKAHMSLTCPAIEEGVSLTSHYVDVQVSQRETFRSGKNANRVLDKELIITGDTDRQNSLLGHSQIFGDSNGHNLKRYIVLLGNAGMGKTTLIRKLCLDWSTDCILQFDFVFLLDGKTLALKNPIYSLQTLLLNLSSFATSCTNPEEVYVQILAASKRVLIIFDGFDELRDYEVLLQTQEKDVITSLQKDSKAEAYTVRQLFSAILQRVLLPGCTLLLSTRPRGSANQLLRRADSFLEVCGFTPTDVEAYLSQYFTDPALRATALDYLKNCSYLHLLCWNPGLCRLVCLVLEQSKTLDLLPRTLTGLCHQVLRLKMEKHCKATDSQPDVKTQTPLQSEEETQTQISGNNQLNVCHKNTPVRKSRARVYTCTRSSNQRARRAKKQVTEGSEVDEEEMESVGREVDRTEERELLSQLSSLAWEGVKANSSILPKGRTLSARHKAFGLGTGLLLCHPLRKQLGFSSDEGGGGGEDPKDMGGGEKPDGNRDGGKTEIENVDEGHILLWASPFLQSYLAGVHLSFSRTVSERTFLQNLPFHSGPKGRRRPQREEFQLTQRFAVGLLFHNSAELQSLHSHTKAAFRDMVVNRQALVTKHLKSLSHGDLSPAQVLEACHYVYEASFTSFGDGSRGNARLVAHLAASLPEVLSFHGVRLNPPDVFTVQNILEGGGGFSLDLGDSGIGVSGLRALVGLNNVNSYRACIADVIALWEQLERSGEEGLLRGAVSKFKIHPLKITQLRHVDHLAQLVNIHVHRRLSSSCTDSDSILADGVPAVRELHKLEFELGPDRGPLGLSKLWELLPALRNLQHLDLENSKIGDEGSERLADALESLCSLEILNVSQNCIGDHGLKKLATTLGYLPKLHCLSLYSNVISDEGAEGLAAILPHMASLTDLDVKYNKLTDVGAQCLGASLRNCQKIKTLRMWNQCIPYGVFERLQQQDGRILWH